MKINISVPARVFVLLVTVPGRVFALLVLSLVFVLLPATVLTCGAGTSARRSRRARP